MVLSEKPTIEGTTERKEDFTSVRRVIAGKQLHVGQEEMREALQRWEEIFKNQKAVKEHLLEIFGTVENIPDKFLRTIYFQREKTQEDLEIIRIVNEKTNILRRKFNLPDLNIPQENIYVIPYDAPWPEDFEGCSYFVPTLQLIVVREKNIGKSYFSKVVFAANLLHEMIEFKSYASAKKVSDSFFDICRAGLKIYRASDSNEAYFSNINEAIVEELGIRIFDKLKGHELLKFEITLTNQIKKNISEEKLAGFEFLLNDDIYSIGLDLENSMLLWSGFAYPRQRKILNNLVEKIYRRNADKFRESEQVFNMFANAVFTGRMVRVGRLIDKTFGKGAFRTIAEIDKHVNELEKFIRIE